MDKVAPSPALTQSGDRMKKSLGGRGIGGVASAKPRPSDQWVDRNDDEGYEFVRLLHRSRDHGITAISETFEERTARTRQCKTTGWQSKFAVPYRPLGVPQLQVDRSQAVGESKQPDDTLSGEKHARDEDNQQLSARAIRVNAAGVTPSGRPFGWLPKSLTAMEKFSAAVKLNSNMHKFTMQQVLASDRRVKFVRAGMMASDVLATSASTQASGNDSTTAFLSATDTDDLHPLEQRRRQLKSSARPAQVPALKLHEMLATPGMGKPSLSKPQTARGQLQTATSHLSDNDNITLSSKTPATARTHTGGDESAHATTAGGAKGEHVSAAATAQLTARHKAFAGNYTMSNPLPPLHLLADTFKQEVDSLTARVRAELSAKETERMDTFRRKFKNFELGDMGSTAASQLAGMRLKADQEKLQHAMYLYQNRKWYLELMNQVADQTSDEQRELLKHMREMVEGGTVFTKSTVKDLVGVCTEKGKVEHFTSKPIQDVFDFLCAQFGVLGEEFDVWLEDRRLPLPPSTLARYESARQKRIDLFKKEIVAKHWRHRFDMMATTKALTEWFPSDLVEAVMSSVREPHRRSPDSFLSSSRATSVASSRRSHASGGREDGQDQDVDVSQDLDEARASGSPAGAAGAAQKAYVGVAQMSATEGERGDGVGIAPMRENNDVSFGKGTLTARKNSNS